MHSWTQSWAFWAGILSGLAGAASAAAGMIGGRRPDPAPAGSTARSGAAPGLIEGRAAPIVALSSPATGRDCVQYRERVETSRPQDALEENKELEAVEEAGEIVGHRIVDRAVGVFLVESGAGKAIVWPDEASMSYAEGWTTAEQEDGSRVSSERVLLAGATVRVRGTPGMIADMLAQMSAAAEDLPNELLTALQSRGDLSALPCYWPRGDGFSVEEVGAILDEGDEPAGLGIHLMAAAAAFLLSAVLLICAYRRIL